MVKGEWIATNEAMSTQAARYQAFITGKAANQSYQLNGVKFDGIKNGVLIEAKSGYANFATKEGEFHSWFPSVPDLMDQGRRQLKAAGVTPVEWHFEYEPALEAVKIE